MKVLIVEDDQTTRQFYEEVAKSLKLHPVSCADAETAWAVCEKEIYPIIILDWLLPGMDGLELCQKIRTIPEGKWSTILMATVKNKEKDLRAVLKAGADDYITKPLDIGLLKIRLQIAKNNSNRLMEKRFTEMQLQDLRSQVLVAEKLVSVRSMVSGVSHELNNPLQGILGYAQLLSSEVMDLGIKRDIETIRQLAEQCKTIIHDLLIFSEGAVGEKIEVGLNDVIDRFLDIWGKKLVSENVHVQKKLDKHSPKVHVDVGRLNQVFFHLCQNAVHAMPTGGMLTIETDMEEHRDTEEVEIRFSDTGKGISEENMNRLFDPFFTTEEVGKGKGLGLSFCHGIIREYGGQISARSAGPDKGSTISIRLPVDAPAT